jgi:cytochrome P450
MSTLALDEVPLLSGATWSGHAREFLRDRLALLGRLDGECAPLVRVRFGRKDVLAGNSPAYAHELLVEKARSFGKSLSLRIPYQPLAGEGLFTSEGALWKRQRKLMAPLFAPAQLEEYGACMVELAERAADRWRDGQTIDVGQEMTRITMAVVGRALFDAETFDEADELGQALTTALEWANGHLGKLGLFLQLTLYELFERRERSDGSLLGRWAGRARAALAVPRLLAGARSPEVAGALAKLDGRIQQMIDERRGAGLLRRDLLTRLLGARDLDAVAGEATTMSDRQVRDEAVTLFAAGHETTATALTWSFYLLARHPAAWRRLREEADAVDGRGSGGGSMAPLPFGTRVFKESMRLYPPIYILGRRALEPVEIAGHSFPAQTQFCLSPFAIHRRPDLYPAPERFDPERFTPEAEAARPRTAYLPFGAGPRVCIGNHFALMEGPLVMATLARRLTLEIDPTREVAPAPFASLRPAAPITAVVRKRPAQTTV